MLKINMEVKKGILFVRLNGKLQKATKYTFENEVIPVILKSGIKYIVINLDKVDTIDTYGINSLIELNDLIKTYNGKLTICSITSKNVQECFKESTYKTSFYETDDELTALGVMKL